MLDARRGLAVHPILQPCSLCPAWPGHQGTMFAIGREHIMEPGKVDSWLWYQCGQAGNEIQWLKDPVSERRPVVPSRYGVLSW